MNSRQLYLRLLGYVRPYWRLFIVAIAGITVTGLTEPLLPALIKPLLDETFVEKDPTWIKIMPLLLIGVFVVRGIAHYAGTVALAWVAHKVVFDLREQMYARILDLPTSTLAGRNPGELVSKLSYDVSQVTTATTNALVVAVRDGVAVIGLLAWMLYLDWKLSLIFLFIAPLIAITVKLIARRLRRMSLSLQHSMGRMTHVLEETIRGSGIIKIYGGQAHERERFRRVANGIRSYTMKIVTASAISVPIVQLIVVSALAAVIYITSTQSDMTVGTFVSFFGAAAMLLSPIKRLTALNEQIQRGLAASQSIFGLLDEDAEAREAGIPVGRVAGEIEFRDVSLRYGDGAQVLDGVSFRVAPGETVALVGPSGAGKSSLVNLIPRFYAPDSGSVLVDGVDIATLRLADLRANIAVVSQDVVLFDDTIAANIAYGGNSEASREEIVAAAQAAHVMEFARSMSEGLDTMIGDDGVRLSGGQRQRLAIARALLKDAPILIMDEATSALDSETERQVQAALDNARRGRTTLIIAHRLSTVENADRIVVLDRGRVLECGTHAELLRAGGRYAELHRAQFAEADSTPVRDAR